MSFTKNIKHLVLVVAILFGSLSVMLFQASVNVSAITHCEEVVGDADQQACLDAAAAAAAAESGITDTEFTTTHETFGEGENPIYVQLNRVITFLSIGIGVVVSVSAVFAGIQWTVSRGDPQARVKAVNRITNAGIAVLLYVFGYALLNWLIPGGPF